MLVRRSSNEVFRGRRRGREVYLRMTPAGHRRLGEVEGEVAWMEALAGSGVRVARPVASSAGRLVERASVAGEAVWLACFEAAPGRHARKPDDYQPAVIDSWAGLLADLHEQARGAAAGGGDAGGEGGRDRWDRDRVFETALQDRGGDTAPAQRVLGTLVGWMRGLACGPEVFGLTHADLHLGNLTIDGGQVTAFDFDDACHHWFLHDVAVAVTSIRKAAWEYPDRFDAAAVEARFLDGYFGRGVLGPIWRARLEAFVAYRIALSACWASRAGEIGQLDAELAQWFRRSLPWWLSQLEQGRDRVGRALSA